MLHELYLNKTAIFGTSLVIQCLRLCTSNTWGMGLIPGQELRSHMPCTAAEGKKKNYYFFKMIRICSVQFSSSVVSDSLR